MIWKQYIEQWLKEDIPSFDYSSGIVGDVECQGEIWIKSPGILCGNAFVSGIFEYLNCKVEWMEREGIEITEKTKVAIVKGKLSAILMGERTSLNLLSRLSGISTLSRRAKLEAKNSKTKIAGTRKTTPGFRIFEKYALMVGGIDCHRMDSSSMIMIKDNLIDGSKFSINEIIAKIDKSFTLKIEVECKSLEDALCSLKCGADIVMLDNTESPDVAKSWAREIKSQFPHSIVEVSGGINLDNMQSYLDDSIDYISMSVLTMSPQCLDVSLSIK